MKLTPVPACFGFHPLDATEAESRPSRPRLAHMLFGRARPADVKPCSFDPVGVGNTVRATNSRTRRGAETLHAPSARGAPLQRRRQQCEPTDLRGELGLRIGRERCRVGDREAGIPWPTYSSRRTARHVSTSNKSWLSSSSKRCGSSTRARSASCIAVYVYSVPYRRPQPRHRTDACDTPVRAGAAVRLELAGWNRSSSRCAEPEIIDSNGRVRRRHDTRQALPWPIVIS